MLRAQSPLAVAVASASFGASLALLLSHLLHRRRRVVDTPLPASPDTSVRSVPIAADAAAAAPLVRTVGVCIVQHVLQSADVEQLREVLKSVEPIKLQNRRAHRWEHVHSPTSPVFAELAAHPVIAAAARALLGPKYYLEKCGLIVSHPGSDAQRWHMDTPHLFASRDHLPVHSLSVFVPLCDLVPSNGPTEFQLHSHVKANLVRPQAHATACCTAGAMVMYDTRIMHRGGPNASDTDRPLVYLTLSRVWYRDTLNP